MENDDIFNFVFEQKSKKELFDTEDSELEKQKCKAKQSQKELISFIETIFDPGDKEGLLELLDKRDEDYKQCFHLEQKLYYRNGVKDGISIIVSSVSHK